MSCIFNVYGSALVCPIFMVVGRIALRSLYRAGTGPSPFYFTFRVSTWHWRHPVLLPEVILRYYERIGIRLIYESELRFRPITAGSAGSGLTILIHQPLTESNISGIVYVLSLYICVYVNISRLAVDRWATRLAI
jgi:hypothetical protein